jgi:hypothetical protein
MQNVAILLPTSFDEAHSRQEQADMRQHREATTRRTEGEWLRPNRALGVQASPSQGAQLLLTPHAHFTQRPGTCTPAAASPQSAWINPVPARNGQLTNARVPLQHQPA